MSGALPVWIHAMVVPANTYDSLVGGSDFLQVDAHQVEGSDATDQINAAADQALTDYDAPTKAELDAGFSALNDPTAAAIADQVWDEAKAGHVGAGSFGEGGAGARAELGAAVRATDRLGDRRRRVGRSDRRARRRGLDGRGPEQRVCADRGRGGGRGVGRGAERPRDGGARPARRWTTRRLARWWGPARRLTSSRSTTARTPIQGADVWVSTDAAGSNVVAGAAADAEQRRGVTFMLDTQTYYAWVRKDGFNPVTADSFTVS